MQTLLSSPKTQPILSHHLFPITNPSLSSPPKTLILPTTTTTKQKNLYLHLHATAKGFGSTATTKNDKNNNKNNEKEEQQDQLPQAVFDRIVRRVLVAVGVPMATGIVLMGLLGVVKEEGIWDVPKWVSAVTMLATFGGSAVGIAYGPLSASWDEKRTGTVLGLEEVDRNWGRVWEETDDGDDD